MTIGEKLKGAREEKGLTLRQVQESIKIRTRYLEALENDSFDVIPGEAYVRAFIKGYANFLGLDHIEMLDQYDKIKAEKERKIEEMNEEKQTESSKRGIFHKSIFIKTIIIIVFITAIFFLIYNIFIVNGAQNDTNRVSTEEIVQTMTDAGNQTDISNGSSENDSTINAESTVDNDDSVNINNNNTEISDLESESNPGFETNQGNDINTSSEDTVIDDTELTISNADENGYDNPENQGNTGTESNTGNEEDDENVGSSSDRNKQIDEIDRDLELDIIAIDKSWIQILVDEQKVYEGIMEKGESQNYKYSDNISMKIGNAAGIQVRKENQLMGPWGEEGEVIKKTIED
ncbi:MAG: RodZ domain-containing protein [Halanaerobiales bacterium]